eukprot:CCRYP_015700-RA/>CCRYP_015700-RA protein AED:0.42 eAED:0.42 QI:0/-1/0/1/-1/0/1/0/49
MPVTSLSPMHSAEPAATSSSLQCGGSAQQQSHPQHCPHHQTFHGICHRS